MTAATVRRVDQFTGLVSTVPQYPSRCEVCGVSPWFATKAARLRWDLVHDAHNKGAD